MLGNPEERGQSPANFAERFVHRMQEAHAIARKNLKKAAERCTA